MGALEFILGVLMILVTGVIGVLWIIVQGVNDEINQENTRLKQIIKRKEYEECINIKEEN